MGNNKRTNILVFNPTPNRHGAPAHAIDAARVALPPWSLLDRDGPRARGKPGHAGAISEWVVSGP